jgi:hypothetical protein
MVRFEQRLSWFVSDCLGALPAVSGEQSKGAGGKLLNVI